MAARGEDFFSGEEKKGKKRRGKGVAFGNGSIRGSFRTERGETCHQLVLFTKSTWGQLRRSLEKEALCGHCLGKLERSQTFSTETTSTSKISKIGGGRSGNWTRTDRGIYLKGSDCSLAAVAGRISQRPAKGHRGEKSVEGPLRTGRRKEGRKRKKPCLHHMLGYWAVHRKGGPGGKGKKRRKPREREGAVH